ncbi:MAG TPA: imelysin family protein [Hydrogenophaga sp.]
MKQAAHFSTRRRLMTSLVIGAALPASWPLAHAQVAFPFYSGEHALQGLYSQHMPPRARAFDAAAQDLLVATQQHCQAPGQIDALAAAWRRALLAWDTLSTPALGPVIERRSQRLIDFWPTREALLDKALRRAPQSLADMARVGTPAKGFGAMDHLLQSAPSPAHCPYLVLIAQGIAQEASALRSAFDALAARDWTQDETLARSAFAEWINQWLGGLERLRWMHIEQPVQKAQTAGDGRAPVFARQRMADNQAEWRSQWAALRAQAGLTPEYRDRPPQPGQGLIPIEALLLGKGHIALAQRWTQALAAADTTFAQLPLQPDETTLMALSKTLKGVTSLYQGEVAAALDVPLGFSDADGD